MEQRKIAIYARYGFLVWLITTILLFGLFREWNYGVKFEHLVSLAFAMLTLLYFYTFKVGAVLIGYISGRYLSYGLRYVFVLLVAGAGCHHCVMGEQFFYFNFVLGNILYIASFLVGLYFRRKTTNKKISYYEYFDVALILLITIICIPFYTQPDM